MYPQFIGVFIILITCLVPSTQTQAGSAGLPVYGSLGGDFELDSTLGRPVRLSDYRGKVVLLNFGYTSCPDICPMVLSRLVQVRQLLGVEAAQVQVLFVSFDVARDTVSHLTSYLGYFDSEIVGLTGQTEAIEEVVGQYKGMFFEETGSGGTAQKDGRFFSHTDFVYLIDEQGRVRKLYDTGAKPASITRDVRLLIADAQGNEPSGWLKLWRALKGGQ